MRAAIENIYGAFLLTAMICAPAGVPLVAILLWVTWTGAELRMPLWVGMILAVLIVPVALFTAPVVMKPLRAMVAAGLPPVTLPIAEFVLMNGMVFGGILLIVADPLVALLMTVALACVFRALEPLIERLEKNAPPMGDEA